MEINTDETCVGFGIGVVFTNVFEVDCFLSVNPIFDLVVNVPFVDGWFLLDETSEDKGGVGVWLRVLLISVACVSEPLSDGFPFGEFAA